MLSRDELEKLGLDELRNLARRYGIQPVGKVTEPESWIRMLLAFPRLAIDQTRDGVGLRSPGVNCYFLMGTASDMVGNATDYQMALIRATQMNEWVTDDEDRYYQEKLMQLWEIKQAILLALETLNKFQVNGN